MKYTQRKILAKEILKHAHKLETTGFSQSDIEKLIKNYNNIADNKSLIAISELRNLIYSQKDLKPLLDTISINLNAFVKSPSPRPLQKTIILALISILFISLTIFFWNKTNNQYAANDIHLAQEIIKTIENADMNNPSDMGKIKGAYNSYNSICGKYPSLPRIHELQKNVSCNFRKEFNNEYVCLLTSDGQAKIIQIHGHLVSFVKTAEQARSLFIPTISNNNGLEWIFFVLQILSYISSLITIFDFIKKVFKYFFGKK